MKIWFEGDVLYYELMYGGLSEQFIRQPGYMITEAILIEDDVRVNTDKVNYIVKYIKDPGKTRVVFEEV